MKKVVIIISILYANILAAQTESKELSPLKAEHTPKVPTQKAAAKILYDMDFNSVLYGAVDTVWEHIYAHPDNIDVISRQLYGTSDGSFYLVSAHLGGFLTKFNKDGGKEWVLNQSVTRDTAARYHTEFQDIAERPNGDLLVYGSEGYAYPSADWLDISIPKRCFISPEGVIKDEKLAKNLFKPYTFPRPIYKPFPDTRIIFGSKIDSMILYSVDTSLTTIDSVVFEYEYKGSMTSILGAVSYDSSSFVFCYQGKKPFKDSVFSIIFLHYTKDLKLISHRVLYTGAIGSVAVYPDGSHLVITRGTDYRAHFTKLDRNGTVLWDREPDNLKDIKLTDFKLTRSKYGGFILRSEVFTNPNSGERRAFIGKINDEAECDWYYMTGRRLFRNIIDNFAEATNGDIITVCNSINSEGIFDKETYMQITRLRPNMTSVSEQPEISNAISLYPNPTSTSFTISGVDGVSKLRIVNSVGMEVVNKQSVINKQEVDMSNLPNGLYFVSIRSASGVVVKPMVVIH